MHVIKLDGYNATTENGEKLELGTFDSFGEEQLQIVKAPDWANLSVIATFNPPNAFWLDKAYTHLDNGLLTEEDIAEVETLAQAYYDAVDAETVQDGNATNEQIKNPLCEEEDQ